MKKAFLILLLVNGTVLASLAQSVSQTVSELKALFQTEHPEQATALVWSEQAKSLQIGDYVFPVGKNTKLSWSKAKETGFRVEFFLQEGTAIKHLHEQTFRRAYWAIPFSSKESCKTFIKLLQSLDTTTQKS
ncbi:MAG: hypothetical protein U0Y10_01490 [Spirosomataceae bacterium]